MSTNNNVECVICMDCISSKEINYTKTECGHEFHTSCLLQNLAHNGLNCLNCPYCRSVMASKPVTYESYSYDFSEDVTVTLSDDEDEDEDANMHEDDILRGLRLFFQRVENLVPEEAGEEESQDILDEEHIMLEQTNLARRQLFLPPIQTMVEYLTERGVTYTDLLKSVLYSCDDDYNDDNQDLTMTTGRVLGKVCALKRKYRAEELLRQISVMPDPLVTNNRSSIRL